MAATNVLAGGYIYYHREVCNHNHVKMQQYKEVQNFFKDALLVNSL